MEKANIDLARKQGHRRCSAPPAGRALLTLSMDFFIFPKLSLWHRLCVSFKTETSRSQTISSLSQRWIADCALCRAAFLRRGMKRLAFSHMPSFFLSLFLSFFLCHFLSPPFLSRLRFILAESQVRKLSVMFGSSLVTTSRCDVMSPDKGNF